MYNKYARLRDEKGVSDYQVANATGVSPSSLSDWKNGRYTIKVDKLKKIADYFEVTVDYFLTEDDEGDK